MHWLLILAGTLIVAAALFAPAPTGAVGMGAACFLGIVARILQAWTYQHAVLEALRREHPPVQHERDGSLARRAHQ